MISIQAASKVIVSFVDPKVSCEEECLRDHLVQVILTAICVIDKLPTMHTVSSCIQEGLGASPPRLYGVSQPWVIQCVKFQCDQLVPLLPGQHNTLHLWFVPELPGHNMVM